MKYNLKNRPDSKAYGRFAEFEKVNEEWFEEFTKELKWQLCIEKECAKSNKNWAENIIKEILGETPT